MPSTQQPNNVHSASNPVGRFMVAAGAVIELKDSGKILINQRSQKLDWNPGEWEIVYGRIAQFESLEEGLKREVREETGVEVEIVGVMSAWHMFRGTEESAENELIGVTYHCRTASDAVRLSDEHAAYKWVTPEEAYSLISVVGIRRDLQIFIDKKNSTLNQ